MSKQYTTADFERLGQISYCGHKIGGDCLRCRGEQKQALRQAAKMAEALMVAGIKSDGDWFKVSCKFGGWCNPATPGWEEGSIHCHPLPRPGAKEIVK